MTDSIPERAKWPTDEEQEWLDDIAPKLLRDEYPDQMAQRSCTCEAKAVCGAHRLLARYDELYKHLKAQNADRRRLRAEVAAMRPVVEAAVEWRDRVSGSVLGAHELPLCDAVDPFYVEWFMGKAET